MAPGGKHQNPARANGNPGGEGRRGDENQRRQEWGILLQEIKNEAEKGIVVDGILNAGLAKKTEEFAIKLRNTGITSSSIRKIYESFVNVRMQMQHEFMRSFNEKKEDKKGEAVKEADKRAFDFVYPRILLLKSKSRYILERKKTETRKDKDNENESTKAAYDALERFITTLADRVKSRDEVEAMVDLFECIIANLKEEKK